MSNFEKFNLDEKILKVLQEIKYEIPTAIQEQAIPKILSGCDLIASAQTGTGKTGAFMLPILHSLEMNPVEKHVKPRALILVPTRELALQVSEEAKKYSKHMPHIRTVCVYGGIPYPVQKRALSCHYDVLIATPGRLIENLDMKRIDLSNVQVLVLDEADRMLDMGFIDDVEQITAYLPKKRQTLLFSATIDNKILPISKKLQNNPHEIRVKQDLSLKDNIDASFYYVDDINHKMKLLDHFLEKLEMTQMIIFTSTIVQTKALARYLQDKDFLAGALHGDMDQKQRTKTINRLRKGTIQILVATDVAARGIDIASLSHVLNFDLPFQSEDFIHRIGRTGRAGAKGSAITFATYKESLMLSRIEKLIGKPLAVHTIEGMEPKPKTRENSQPIQRRRSRGRERTQENSFQPRRDFKKPFTRNLDSTDQKRPFYGNRQFKSENANEEKNNFRKPFKQRNDSFSEREFKKPFKDAERKNESYFERKQTFKGRSKDFNDRPSFNERSDKPSFKGRFKDSNERPSFNARGDKPSFKGRFKDSNDRPSFKERNDRPSFKERFNDSNGKPSFPKRDRNFINASNRPQRREKSFNKKS